MTISRSSQKSTEQKSGTIQRNVTLTPGISRHKEKAEYINTLSLV